MSVLCIGQTAYDITLPIDEEFRENIKYQVFEKLECLGGPATNAAYLNAKWGLKTYLISRIGNDNYGKKIIADLKAVGLNTDYILECENTALSFIVNNRKNASRTIFNNPNKLNEVEVKYPENVDVLLLDGHDLAISLTAIKRYPQAISILDAGSCREENIILAREVDYLVCSYDFARVYVGYDFDPNNQESYSLVFDKLKEINQHNIVVTLGENGLIYEKDGIIYKLDAYKVDAVDTTGAGDVFHGAFAYAMHEKYSLKKALEISSMAAAISVTKMGGNPSIPSFEEVIENIVKR